MSKRDDLFESDPPEEKKPVEGQDEDFFFEMTDDEPQGTEAQDEPVTDEQSVVLEEPDPEKGGSRQRMLLLLLLVIVLLGVGYFLLGEELFGPKSAPAPKVVKSQPQKLKIPERKKIQQEQKAVEEVVIPQESVAGTPVEKQPDIQEKVAVATKEPVDKASVPEAAESGEGQQVPTAAEVRVAEVAVEESAKLDESSVAPEVVAKAKSVDKALPESDAVKSPYTLQIGAYVLEANLGRTLETVKSLGYEPIVLEGKKTVSMTRLRIGAYPEEGAREKLIELQRLVPSAFLLKEGEQLTLYAGSYYGLDRARVQADLLYQHQIHVDEETVDVAIPIKTIRFGGFADVKAARVMAKKATEAGLEALVIQQN